MWGLGVFVYKIKEKKIWNDWLNDVRFERYNLWWWTSMVKVKENGVWRKSENVKLKWRSINYSCSTVYILALTTMENEVVTSCRVYTQFKDFNGVCINDLKHPKKVETICTGIWIVSKNTSSSTDDKIFNIAHNPFTQTHLFYDPESTSSHPMPYARGFIFIRIKRYV